MPGRTVQLPLQPPTHPRRRRAHTASSKSCHRLLPPADRFLGPRRLLLRHLPRDEALEPARSAGGGERGYKRERVGAQSWVLWLADNRDRVESAGRSLHSDSGAGLQGCTDAGLARLLTGAGEADPRGCGGASRLGHFESFLWIGGNSAVSLVGAKWKDEGGWDCGCGSRAEEKRSELEMG